MPIFYGSFSYQGFSLRRVLAYRNSFNPTTEAAFRPNFEGTDVELKIKPPWFAIIFFVTVPLIIAVTGGPMLLLGLALNEVPGWTIVLALAGLAALPLLFGAICFLSYRREANKAAEVLPHILDGSLVYPR